MSKVFLGTSLAELNIGQESLPISRVNLNVDSDTYYTAGDDTGRIIECECPWGTQAMADDILASLRGYIYKPFEGNDALLDPAAELGDTIDVGGFHGVISMLGRNLDRQSVATVGAPGVDEIEDEYPYKSHERRQTDRVLARTRAMITKSAEEIKLLVEEVDGKYTELAVTLGGITITTTDEETGTSTTTINGAMIETGTLKVTNADISGKLSVNKIRLGGDMSVYKSTSDSSTKGGSIGYAESAIDGSLGIHMISEDELGEVMATDNGAKLTFYNADDDCINQIYIADNGAGIVVNDMWYDFYANRFLSEDGASLGSSSFPWSAVYAETGEISPSDRNLKNSIEELPDKYITMLGGITPRRFKLNNGSSDRYHVGFIAQEVEAAMEASGIDTQEFGGFIKDKDAEGNDVYMLRYAEFIAILAAKIQSLERDFVKMEERLQ